MWPRKTATLPLRIELSPPVVHRYSVGRDLIDHLDGPDHVARPAAVEAFATLTIFFGDGPVSTAPRRSKRLSGWHRLPIDVEEPTAVQWAEAEAAARLHLVLVLMRHDLVSLAEQSEGDR